MSKEAEELKAKIDCVLSDDRYLQRTIDQVARQVSEEPARVLRFCRVHTGYNLSYFKNDIFVALTDRVSAAMEEEEKKLEEAMQGGEESKEDLDKARLQPVRLSTPTRTDWGPILHNISHVLVTLYRTARWIPSCEQKIAIEQAIRDLEKCYAVFSKKTTNQIE